MHIISQIWLIKVIKAKFMLFKWLNRRQKWHFTHIFSTTFIRIRANTILISFPRSTRIQTLISLCFQICSRSLAKFISWLLICSYFHIIKDFAVFTHSISWTRIYHYLTLCLTSEFTCAFAGHKSQVSKTPSSMFLCTWTKNIVKRFIFIFVDYLCIKHLLLF